MGAFLLGLAYVFAMSGLYVLTDRVAPRIDYNAASPGSKVLLLLFAGYAGLHGWLIPQLILYDALGWKWTGGWLWPLAQGFGALACFAVVFRGGIVGVVLSIVAFCALILALYLTTVYLPGVLSG
ncbi:hypothetical protein GCM10007907_24520 [Chitinimonas prasina]|uniref:Uncharacterized protein n=1 Tax=Chitinimonas prasina TaxID=1434937 RepID=A0ABQ5YJ16_9NEIS|nr:hypothetical protein [Chitinimonas prasina]GLR13662.1 hypothetical protein GCM10007907_24520 [Chitinimonas prasina]